MSIWNVKLKFFVLIFNRKTTVILVRMDTCMFINKEQTLNTNEITETDAIKNMILAAAPERESELNELWNEYYPQFSLREDTVGFSMEVIFETGIFDHKTMCQMWLLGFAAQKALHTYSPFLICSKLFSFPLSNESLLDDADYVLMERDFQNVLDNILKIKTLANIDEFTWLENIPQPYNGKPKDIDGSMTFDLICISGAYCFLHELQHIKFSKNTTRPDVHKEEIACDAFAREFLLSKADDYETLSGYSAKLVLSKRAMGIAMSTFLLFVITPKERWCETNTHPRIKDRIVALTDYVKMDANDYFWLYFSSLLMALAKRDNLLVEPIIVESQKDYCLYLIELLDESIPKKTT